MEWQWQKTSGNRWMVRKIDFEEEQTMRRHAFWMAQIAQRYLEDIQAKKIHAQRGNHKQWSEADIAHFQAQDHPPLPINKINLCKDDE